MKVRAILLGLTIILHTLSSCSGRNSELALSGVLETDDYDFIAPFTAKLIEIRVEEGDSVQNGDTLAVLDTVVVAAQRRSALSAVNRTRANLYDLMAGSDKEKIMAAESRLQNAVATLEQARRDLTRAQKLHTDGLINDQSLEQTQLLLQRAVNNERIANGELADLKRGARTHEIDAAEAVLSQAEANLAVLEKQFNDAFLTASINGVVHLVPYQLGETVPAGRSVATVHSNQNLWIRIFIPEDKLDRVKLGDSLNFSVDAYPDSEFMAVISYISTSAEFTPRNVQSRDERLNLVFAVKLIVVDGIGQLRAGMPADFHL